MAHPRSAGSDLPSTTPVARSSPRFSRGRGPERGFRRYWNPHHKSAPGSGFIAPTLNFPAMRPHDPVTNAQAEPRPFARLLGGIKRVKNALRIGYSRSVVDDRHFDHLRLPTRVNLDAAALPCFLHRIVRIVQDIQKNLLHLLGVAQRRQLLFKIFDHLHAMAGEIITPQLDGLSQYAVDLHELSLHRPLPRETQQILHDILRSLRLLQDDLQIFPR